MFLLIAAALIGPQTYTVRPGDTLSGIAETELGQAGLWPGLCSENALRSCDLIYPGERIRLTIGPRTEAKRAALEPVSPSRFVSGGTLSYTGLEALWQAAGGPSWAAPTAACIAEHESGGQQYATGGVGERGYWQINPDHGSLSTYDPYDNARAAVILSDAGQNWAPWTTAPACGV